MANDDDYSKLMKELQENLRISGEEEEENEKIEDENVNNELENDFEVVTGYREGSKLLWIPSEKYFYKQNSYSKTYDGMAYTCYDSECTARKVLKDNETITLAATHVPHLSMYKMYKELFYLNEMKKMCKTEPHTVSVKQIYDRVQAA